MTGLRLVIPRDPWPRLGSERATRVAMATIYALVLLVALAEVARSLARADRLDYAYYPKLGEVVLSGGDPYANAFNTWPPFFLLVAAGLALDRLRREEAGDRRVVQFEPFWRLFGAVRKAHAQLAVDHDPQAVDDPLLQAAHIPSNPSSARAVSMTAVVTWAIPRSFA